MTATPPPLPRRGRVAQVVIPALAVLGLVLLGTAAWVESRPASGWFAYAPLSDTTYVPAATFAPGTAVLLSGAGALLIGGAVGFVVGRRSRPVADEL